MDEAREGNGRACPIRMRYGEFLACCPAMGTLKVQASRGRGAVPTVGARVLIVREFTDARVLFFSGETDANGIIAGIVLPSPRRTELKSPGRPPWGALYQVYVTHPDFAPERYDVELIADATVILPVALRMAARGE